MVGWRRLPAMVGPMGAVVLRPKLKSLKVQFATNSNPKGAPEDVSFVYHDVRFLQDYKMGP